MKRILILLVTIGMFGCNPIQTFEDMAEKQGKFNELSLKELGTEAFVGWNITNGKLNTVTVTYPQGTLNEITVGELETTTLKIVAEVFQEKPNVITFGVQSIREER